MDRTFIGDYVQVRQGEHAGKKGTVADIGVAVRGRVVDVMLEDSTKLTTLESNLRSITKTDAENFESRFNKFRREMGW